MSGTTTEYRVVPIDQKEGEKGFGEGFKCRSDAQSVLNGLRDGSAKLQAREVVKEKRIDGPWRDIPADPEAK